MKNEISNILSLINSGDSLKALQEAKSFYNKNENNIDAVKVLAYTYIQIGNFERVIEVLKRGYSKRNDQMDFDYFNNMGYALSQIEEFEESITYLKKASELNNSPSADICLAEVFLKQRKFKDSKEVILIALDKIKKIGVESFSKFANVFLLISEINGALKQDEETIELFIQILKERFNENIFFLLCNISPGYIEKEIINKAESYLLINEDSFKNKIERFNYVTPLYFGLAMYYQSKDKEKSEAFFDNGNKEIFKSTRYNSHQYQERIVKTMDLYLKKYKSFDEGNREHGEKNFFIVGSPRSGTTLIESIVTANDKVFSGGELKSGKDIIEKNVLSKEQSLSDLNHRFISKYLRRTSYLRDGHDYIVDKMPENFLYLGIIQKLLPQSKIIRVFRNPWDTAISLYKQRYVINVPYSVSFFNIGVFLANFEAINLFWDKHISIKKNILDLKYEDLVSDYSSNQNIIYEFLEVDMKYDDKKRKEFFSPTASIRQVKEGIHQRSVEKKEFQHHKAEFVDAILMQREYWAKKNISSKKDKFFGYTLD
jgi:tetratricopeptide (TPR) repeat protein